MCGTDSLGEYHSFRGVGPCTCGKYRQNAFGDGDEICVSEDAIKITVINATIEPFPFDVEPAD